MGRWSPNLSRMTRFGPNLARQFIFKSFIFILKQWRAFFSFLMCKKSKMKEQREMTRFRNKKSLGLSLPHGTWALNLGPSSSHYGTLNSNNNNIYYTARA
jgi:hypothetical protein